MSTARRGPIGRGGDAAADLRVSRTARADHVRGVAARFLTSRILRLAVTLTCVAVLVRTIDTTAAVAGLRETDARWALPAVFLTAMSVVAGAVVWGLLVRCSSHRISWRVLGVWYAEGVFAAEVVPAGVGGDALRGVQVTRAAGAPTAVASLAGSRLVGALAIAVWGLCGAVLLRSSLGPVALGLTSLIVTVVVAGSVLVLNAERLTAGLAKRGPLRRRVARRIDPFTAALSVYRRRPGVIGQVVVVGLIGWAMQLCALTVFARSLGIDVGWQVFAVAMPVTLLATWLPVAANGIGVKEGVLVGLLSHGGVSTAHAATLTLLIDLQMVPFAAAGALVWLSSRRRGSVPRPAPEPAER